MSEYKGACACGALTFELAKQPMITQACHCQDCQRASGAPFVVNMWIEAANVSITSGELATGQVVGGSGKPVTHSFCPACGTTVWSRYHAAPGEALFVRTCCLEDDSDIEPELHIFTRTQKQWIRFDDSVPQFSEFYNPAKVFSPQSLQRLAAMAE